MLIKGKRVMNNQIAQIIRVGHMFGRQRTLQKIGSACIEFDLFSYLKCHKMYGKSELKMMYVIHAPLLTTFLQGVFFALINAQSVMFQKHRQAFT
jgi:hypothetical protein